MADTYRPCLVSYPFEGKQWSITIPARSHEDAEARLAQLVFGRVDGELKLDLPLPDSSIGETIGRTIGAVQTWATTHG